MSCCRLPALARDDCPVCQQDGPHYVPQGCIRSLLAKVVALSERVDTLEFGSSVREAGDMLDAQPVPADDRLMMPEPTPEIAALLQQTASATLQKPTQSERMKQYWRNKKAQGA